MGQRTILTGEIERETPADLFDALEREFMFEVDVCATAVNAKCPIWFGTQEDGSFVDGLTARWAPRTVWCNPPYAHGSVAPWLRKARHEVALGATVVCLLPVDTSTAWFHDHVFGCEVRFLRGRLRFGGTKGPAPFASMIVVMRPDVPAGSVVCRL